MHDAGGTGDFDGADEHDEVLSSWNVGNFKRKLGYFAVIVRVLSEDYHYGAPENPPLSY
jgi:hypothetical protein